ncbi:biotin-dependent carboxylase-like uncharacterized protein [Diaminobutyricimonas aerilata]|uniref:Biotin-dependent carboxylase-like uncharacterized protein n=1 Tax=Diaminobutyricimonas aerilata TaxID=1162967 RepID=A0A2M9CMI0_9MICO|nr:biotin-dependent carboxyltransferase family protein [Diaminobutyricimonas aerilata]PJJ73088.1 biotin-dependent carboxylase-like uncharacterized protein [Diaminobutyricimonas aerilata]
MSRLEVIAPGASALVQDLGRPGLAHLGVGAAGAADRAAHALADRLVGNPPEAATLEIAVGGARLRFPDGAWIAVTGAWGPLTIDGMPLEPHTATRVSAEAVVDLPLATHGIRYVLAVRGGIDVPVVLGSRSRDTLAALGPAPLAAGDVLPIGPEPATPVPVVDLVPVDPPTLGTIDLVVHPGPRLDWFAPDTWRRLLEQEWTVSARSDRTGVRLEGAPLERSRSGELPSEGMLPGAIQVSPDGAPTVLGVDGPVTGGYPVVAVVTSHALDRLAQARPGQRIRFVGAALHV